MSRSVDSLRIAQFRLDRSLLLYQDIDIARRMAMDKSNFSAYINGRKTITNMFLRKFYTEFGDEIDKIKKGDQSDTNLGNNSITLHEFLAEYKERRNFLLNRCDVLIDKYEKLVIGHQQFASEFGQLEDKIERLLLRRVKETGLFQRMDEIEKLVKG